MIAQKAATILLLVVILLSFTSCKDAPVEPVVCTTEYVYGLEIRLVDSETGGPTGLRSLATIRDGDYEEVALFVDMGQLGVATLAAGERAGTYDISIVAEGYMEWNRNGVRVTKDECHVKTVSLVAELVREEP